MPRPLLRSNTVNSNLISKTITCSPYLPRVQPRKPCRRLEYPFDNLHQWLPRFHYGPILYTNVSASRLYHRLRILPRMPPNRPNPSGWSTSAASAQHTRILEVCDRLSTGVECYCNGLDSEVASSKKRLADFLDGYFAGALDHKCLPLRLDINCKSTKSTKRPELVYGCVRGFVAEEVK